LDQPFVDGFGWVGHEDATFEVGLSQDVGKGGGMVEMETGVGLVSSALEEQHVAGRNEGTKAGVDTPIHEIFAWLDGGGFERHCIVVHLDWYMIWRELERIASIQAQHIRDFRSFVTFSRKIRLG
jgi:hypothetical protein